jgi:hypothetical protein
MALIGSAPALRCSCGGTLLVGKDVQPLQSVKPIRIAVSTVLDESWCGHKTSVWVWDVFDYLNSRVHSISSPKTLSRSLPYTQTMHVTSGSPRELPWCGTLMRL